MTSIFPGASAAVWLIAGLIFIGILGVMLYYFFVHAKQKGNAWDDFAEATASIVDSENADAIAFIPYSDGPLIPKPAIYDRDLLGGTGGYRTEDGDRIYVDGQGNGKFTLGGVDVIMAIDPTEHAAAADPLKAWISYLMNDMGEWIKVDRQDNIIEAGEALLSLDGVTPAMDVPKDEGVLSDGGYVSEVHEKAIEERMSLTDAKAELEEAGLLTKIVDLAPPREAVIDEETGHLRIEEATHVAVDVSKAADLLPKKTNTTDWQTMEERARQEGMDQDKLMEYFIYGGALGGLIGGGVGVIMALIFAFT